MIPEGVWSWDEGRTRREILALLPKGWGFSFFQDSGTNLWVARMKNEEGDLVFDESDTTANLTLFTAYGWLSNRQREANPGPLRASPWVRRRELTLAEVHAEATRRAPDPLDVDPAEVEAVYQSHRHK